MIDKARVIELAKLAGFKTYNWFESVGGISTDDETVAVGEYPCGELVLKLAALIEEELLKMEQKP